MHVVATAGHVDHGKSTLVKALTGADPDRLEQERRRGLSIELGYCWTELPGVGDVAFVDVPGHERFVATTLAGVGPVPVVLFVVAADDPWMPQAQEHLDALSALDVAQGVLVVTRADLADPAPALAAARFRLASTPLADVPEAVVSGRTGEGLEHLVRVLSQVLTQMPQPAASGDVRLWTDRRFHVRGTGTVVTGTLGDGTITVGDELVEAGSGRVVRVRGIESLGRPARTVTGAARVALALGGDGAADAHRGGVLVTPGAFEDVTRLDVGLRPTDGERPSVPGQVQLHVGATVRTAHVRPLGADHARLTLHRPAPLRVVDRLVLRDPGSHRIWGARVLDVSPPDLTRRGDGGRRATALEAWDPTVAGELVRRGVVPRSRLRRWGVAATGLPEGTVDAAGWLVSASRSDSWRHEIAQLLRGTAVVSPTTDEVARRLDLPDAGLVSRLLPAQVHLVSGRLRRDGDAVPTPEMLAAVDALAAELGSRPFDAPPADRLRALGLEDPVVHALHRAGLVLRLDPGVVLGAGADDRAVATLAELPEPFTVSQARQSLGSSRRVVLPLLAHLERSGRLVRLADDTRRLRRPQG